MKRYLLNGITLRVPFLGELSTLVTEGDWRGAGDGPKRPFMCNYEEPGNDGVQYHFGWLTISRDPVVKGGSVSTHAVVIAAVGCSCAARVLMLVAR
jgi:hypothetical protein